MSGPAGAPLLDVEAVSKGYGPPGDGRVEVLRGVSFSLGAGEGLAVTGPSGSGKSTLLNIVGSLEEADAGAVRLGGREVSALRGAELASYRSRRVGFVFQLHHLLPQLTVLENVLLPVLAAGRMGDGDRARRLLERVGLSGRAHYRPARLSGGERQRAAVVRALVNRPALLLADEPTGSLDRASSEALADLLDELRTEEGTALLLVTHSPALAERVGRSLELRDGVLSG